MPLFREKSTVEAIQFTGHNDAEVLAFCPTAYDPLEREASLIIPRIEGEFRIVPGDWVLRMDTGDFYPCKAKVFSEKYEPVA